MYYLHAFEYIASKGIKHIGYIDCIFKTKKDACEYYDKHNPHMRSLNTHDNYKSDWDPNNKLLYTVEESIYPIICNLPLFKE